MKSRWTALAAALVVCLAIPALAAAEEPEMDPLLELLVEQGVITAEQAAAVQAEVARRQAGDTPAAPVAAVPAAPAATQVAEVAPAPEAEPKKEKWY
ncbi:MAG: hypothetical protein AB1Z65_11195, partial [Candidatus Sulfomarinibacteraceae bacterium]